MTPQEIERLTTEIIGGLETGAAFIGLLAPEVIPFIVLGKAVDKVIPGLVGDISKWVEGNQPTLEEIDEFKKKLAVLADPNAP